jgi:hypothetical protein
MDSEMYSDFTGARSERDGPIKVGSRSLHEQRWECSNREASDSLAKCLSEINELDQKIEKRLDDFLAQVVPVNVGGTVVTDIVSTPIQVGGALQDIIVSEVNQLLSDVRNLKDEITESEKDHGVVQVGGGSSIDLEAKFSSMQGQIDALKDDVCLGTENLANLMSYFKSRGTNKPMSIKGGMKDGKLVIHAIERE